MSNSPIYLGRSEVKFADGTTGIKAVLVDADGAARASAQRVTPIAIAAAGVSAVIDAPPQGQRICLTAIMCKPSADLSITHIVAGRESQEREPCEIQGNIGKQASHRTESH